MNYIPQVDKDMAVEIVDSLYEIFGGSDQQSVYEIGHGFWAVPTGLRRYDGIKDHGCMEYSITLAKLDADKKNIIFRDMTNEDLFGWYRTAMIKIGKWA